MAYQTVYEFIEMFSFRVTAKEPIYHKWKFEHGCENFTAVKIFWILVILLSSS